jgi:hypothetical protein
MDIKGGVVNITLDILREELRSIEKYNTGNSVFKKQIKPSLDAKTNALRDAILTLGHFGGTHRMTDKEQQEFFGFEDPYK